MPLTEDPKVVALSQSLIAAFDSLFGRHPGFRAAHAKGVILHGTFTPSPSAHTLSSAPHLQPGHPSPVVVRFSNSTGVPNIPDVDGNSSPKGVGIRFMLGDRVHTDIIAHSTDGFPTHNGDEFLAFLQAIATSDMKAPSDPANPKPIERFLHGHPAALTFVTTPKPIPVSFAQEKYFSVSAFQFTNADGQVRYGKYRILPKAGTAYLDDAAAAGKGPNFLMDELHTRVAQSKIAFTVQVQLAGAGDVTNDSTAHWPEDREVLELGGLELTEEAVDSAGEGQRVIYDPFPRVQGIEASDDPLNELRAAVYIISGRRRRADPPLSTPTALYAKV